MRKLLDDLYNARIGIIVLIIYSIIMQVLFGNLCPIKVFLHHDCPGCGLTRAAIALFKGDITSSLEYNPTCIGWLSVFILFFIDRYIKTLKIKPFPSLFIVISSITIIWFLFIK